MKLPDVCKCPRCGNYIDAAKAIHQDHKPYCIICMKGIDPDIAAFASEIWAAQDKIRKE